MYYWQKNHFESLGDRLPQSAKGQVRHTYSTSILSLGKVGQKFPNVACEHKHKPNQKYTSPNVMGKSQERLPRSKMRPNIKGDLDP